MREIALPRWRGRLAMDARIAAVGTSLVARAKSLTEPLLEDEIEAALASFRDYDPRHGYAQIKPHLASIDAQLSQERGAAFAQCFGLSLLLRLIETAGARWPLRGLDDRLKPEFIDSFHRILDAIDRGGSDATRMSHDSFAKDFAISLFRLIPAGAQLIDPGSGVERRLVLRPPVTSIPRKICYMTLRCGGFKPFGEFHTHLHMRHWFTSDGWEYTFRLLPAIFGSFPRLKGVVAGSWFYDPKLAEISPSLNFVRTIPEEWGAILVRNVEAPDVTGAALSLSTHRRELYDQGKYSPISYTMVAARNCVLARARAIGVA